MINNSLKQRRFLFNSLSIKNSLSNLRKTRRKLNKNKKMKEKNHYNMVTPVCHPTDNYKINTIAF